MASRLLLLTFICSLCILSEVLADFCEPNQSIAHPFNCSLFYFCDSKGDRHQFACPEGLHYNPSKGCCDWPENAKCNSSPNFTNLEGEEKKEVAQDDDLVSAPNDHDIVEHPRFETIFEIPQSQSIEQYEPAFHSSGDVKNHTDNEEAEEHFIKKRDIYDHETAEDEGSSNNSTLTVLQPKDIFPPVEVERIDEISKAQELLATFLHLLAEYPSFIPYSVENNTDHGYTADLGYNNSQNTYIPEQRMHESHEEIDPPKDEEENGSIGNEKSFPSELAQNTRTSEEITE